jgi:hypothetical protein
MKNSYNTMSEWDYEFVVCGDNRTGEEHYLFTLKDEDTCLRVTLRENDIWTHLLNICFSYLYLLI